MRGIVDLRELLLGVLGEHSDEDVIDNFDLGFVKSCDFNENIPGFGADLRMVAVDDGW